MRILYIEDDLVDQMMFQRLSGELNIECTVVESFDELTAMPAGPDFDIIFSDVFLPDGNINDVLTHFQGKEVIILSGETNPEFLSKIITKPYGEVYSKPLAKEQLQAIMSKRNTSAEKDASPQISGEDYTAIKLSNLERLSKGDPQDMVELMDIALNLLPQRMDELATGFADANWGQVHFSAHAAKSVSRLVGIPVYEELGELDRKARLDEPNPEELFKIYEDLLPILKKAYEELTELKGLISQ